MTDLLSLPSESIGTLLTIIMVSSAGPLAVVRLARICYPRKHPSRICRQLLDELVRRRLIDQLPWALQQLDRAIFEQLLPRSVTALIAVVGSLRRWWSRQRR